MTRKRAAAVLVMVVSLATTAHADERPETPSRDDGVAAMNGVSEAGARGGRGGDGLIPTAMVFEGQSGRVTSALAGGDAPPEVKRCAEAAVGAARVRPFRQAEFRVNYPFRIFAPGTAPRDHR
ncbi:MAG: hypothetical protein AB7S26_34360 [Sandaracinaceae bacterium]